MWLDEASGEGHQIEDKRQDFEDTRSVLVNKVLYVFKFGSPVSAYKIAEFTSINHMVKTTLSSLPRNDKLEYFAVSYVAGSIILTGG